MPSSVQRRSVTAASLVKRQTCCRDWRVRGVYPRSGTSWSVEGSRLDITISPNSSAIQSAAFLLMSKGAPEPEWDVEMSKESTSLRLEKDCFRAGSRAWCRASLFAFSVRNAPLNSAYYLLAMRLYARSGSFPCTGDLFSCNVTILSH